MPQARKVVSSASSASSAVAQIIELGKTKTSPIVKDGAVTTHQSRTVRSFGSQKAATQKSATASRATPVILDTTTVDIWGGKNIKVDSEVILYESDTEKVFSKLLAFTKDDPNDKKEAENTNAVCEVFYANKNTTTAASIYFSISPTSFRTDITQAHLDKGPLFIAAASGTTPAEYTTVSLGQLARRFGQFSLQWGIVIFDAQVAQDATVAE